MKVLVIGSGGREHALCWKLKQSAKVTELYCAPGNPGTAQIAENVSIKLDDIAGLLQFAQSKQIDLTVVGPEYPLTLGLADEFRAHGLNIFGASKAASMLEASKSFCKEVMTAAGVPTAAYKRCTSRSEAEDYLRQIGVPVVIKEDGLAAGKGVFVCFSQAEVVDALGQAYRSQSNAPVVIEQFLEGVEASYIVAVGQAGVVPLAVSNDYKRIGDGQTGPNTGGMGTVSPTTHLSPALEATVMAQVIEPVLEEMKRRGTPYEGFLYAGLMITPQQKIYVLEFNARLGDPETQVIVRRMESDLAELLFDLATGEKPKPATWNKQTALCVVLAAAGYPAEPQKGDRIDGIDQAQTFPDTVVFHAGTARGSGSTLLTAGGRVLNVTSIGKDLNEARTKTYRAVDMIQFRGRQVRRDIGL